MTGLDARFLYSETSTAHMHTLKVVVVDVAGRTEALTPELMEGLIGERIRRMPVLRRRVVSIPHHLGNPVVFDDAEFDLSRHLRITSVAPPGDARRLDQAVAAIAGVPLPRDRPLWELTVLEGLEGGRVAFVMKIHHALADGVAAVALLENAFVVDEHDAVAEPFEPRSVPTSRELYRAAGSGVLRAMATAPRVARRSVGGARRARVARKAEVSPPPGPFVGPRTPFNVALSADRTFATLAVPIPALAVAKEAAGATLNDAFLALCGGGVRRYLQRMGALPADTLVASVPMATRTDRRRLSGNHVDNLFLPLRTDVADPTERIALVHESAAAARRVRAELGPDLFESRSALVPAGAHGVLPRAWAATRLANHVRPPLNLVASCVRGPREALELDGGVVTSLFSSGPILEGIGLNITAWTYVDTMYLSILGCSASLPDPWRLSGDLQAELADWPTTT